MLDSQRPCSFHARFANLHSVPENIQSAGFCQTLGIDARWLIPLSYSFLQPIRHQVKHHTLAQTLAQNSFQVTAHTSSSPWLPRCSLLARRRTVPICSHLNVSAWVTIQERLRAQKMDPTSSNHRAHTRFNSFTLFSSSLSILVGIKSATTACFRQG